MKFEGYLVDHNISAFRQHFSIGELLDAMDPGFPYTLQEWFENIRKSGTLNAEEQQQVEELQCLYKDFRLSAHCAAIPEEEEENHGQEEAEWEGGIHERCTPVLRDFAEKLVAWRERVPANRQQKYRCFTELLCAFLNLVGHSHVDECECTDAVEAYLTQDEYLYERLSLSRINDKKLVLRCNENIVEFIGSDVSRLPEPGLVYAVQHPDTGWIGIDTKGRVINHSAFEIPSTDCKAVLVQLSQAAYVILFEDGSLLHNIAYAEIPDVPVIYAELKDDRISCRPMYETNAYQGLLSDRR